MKFNSLLYFLFLSFSINFGQTKVFIKFREHIPKENIKKEISSLIENKSLLKTGKTSKQITEVKSFFEEFGHLNNSLDRISTVILPANIDIEKFIADIQKNERVEFVQKEVTYKIDDFLTKDSLFAQQWGLQSVHAPEAWELLPSDATKVLLAVIDTGIDYEHPDLKNIIFYNKGELGIDVNGNDKSQNGIDDDNNGFVDDYKGWDFVNKIDWFNASIKDDFTTWDNDPMDENKHGTLVSGIIGAEHNSIGIAGVNPNVKILNLRAFDKNGEGEEDDVASAIIYAVKMGAKVINMSFGDKIYSQVLKDVIEYAHSQNVTLVASSGNSASNLPHYPSGFNQVISVGAIQEDEILAGFSNYGSTLDLVAPGSQILSTALDNQYINVSGTSISAPFVSAAAAILASIKNYSNDEIKQILKSTAKDLGASGWDEKYGAGNLNILKSLQLPVSSEIKINAPAQDYFVKNNTLNIIISVLSPYFKNFTLSYGIGYNPSGWEIINTGKENIQLYKESVSQLNTSGFVDTVYTLRLLVNNINGTTSEERVNFHIDRTKPVVKFASIIPAILNDGKAFAASIATDDISVAQIFFRPLSQPATFDSIYLDGLNNNLKFNRNNHFGIIPTEKLFDATEYEFYFKATNRAGLETIYKTEEGVNFVLENKLNKNLIIGNPKEYKLPLGRIYHAPVSFDTTATGYILLNENETSANLSIYKKGSSNFEKITTLTKRIPVSVGDFNNDGKTDILSLFVKNGFIESQTEKNKLSFTNVFKDTTGTFWPSYAGDIDGDNKTEIIAFSSDTTITVWEVQNDFELIKEAVLNNFVKQISPDVHNSIFRNNQILVDDFNNDSKNEIVTIDNYGRILTYNISGANLYANGKVIEHFHPSETKTVLSKGDFNGDGTNDIGLLMEFENDIFITPVKYSAVLSLKNSKLEILFRTVFVDITSSYVSAYDKKYNSIDFANITNGSKKDFVVNSFPATYIFEYTNNERPNLIFYKTDINTQSIFIGDLDNNGFNEISIPNTTSEELTFWDFNNSLISHPVIEDYYSIDSTKNFIKWKNENKPVKIFFGNNPDSLNNTDTVTGNMYIDNVEPNKTTYYSLAFFDKDSNKIISTRSNIFSIYSHAPAKIKNIRTLTKKNVEILFTEKIAIQGLQLNNFLIDTNIVLSTLEAGSQYSIILNLNDDLSVGNHTLTIRNIRDYYNTPIKDSTLTFSVEPTLNESNKLFISSYKIIDNYNFDITFNINLDTLTALNKNNYTISPNNLVSIISFLNESKNTLRLTTSKPFGSIGKEYTLTIKNLVSSKNTGNIPLNENVGNQIILVTSAKNLNDVYIYPNPAILNNVDEITFANLTNKVKIYIYSLEGKFITMLEEEDSNGGISWNFKDFNGAMINSGIYVYRVIAFDNFNNKVQEKIGKFAFIK